MKSFPVESVRELICEDAIRVRVTELARRISVDYAGRELLVIGILKGAWIFVADLVRLLTVPVMVDFMAVSSYGKGTDSSGRVRVSKDIACSIQGRDVLLVEDILDSGLTMRFLLDELERREPAGIKVCVLMDKPARRRVEVSADYVGFEVPDKFVVGYGADIAERYRNLPFIGYVEELHQGENNETS